VAEGLIEKLSEADTWNGKRVLIPRAAEARRVLPDYLEKEGAQVDVVPVYKTVRPDDTDERILEEVEQGNYDLITFTSSSTAENFAALFGESRFADMADSIRAAAIGPVTAQTLRQLGVTPVVEASEHTIDGLTEAIKGYFER
jgi:uroporphyrinogen III methyltransferase/synthase